MSQASIDLDISHEEFKTIVDGGKKYEQMKENIRNTKSRNELSKNSKDIKTKKMEMHRLKRKIFFLFCVYKMVDISAETIAKNCSHKISQLKRGKKSILWLRIKDVGREFDVKNIFYLVDKEIKGRF